MSNRSTPTPNCSSIIVLLRVTIVVSIFVNIPTAEPTPTVPRGFGPTSVRTGGFPDFSSFTPTLATAGPIRLHSARSRRNILSAGIRLVARHAGTIDSLVSAGSTAASTVDLLTRSDQMAATVGSAVSVVGEIYSLMVFTEKEIAMCPEVFFMFRIMYKLYFF